MRGMKMQKKIVSLGLSLLVLSGTVSSAMAYVYKNGTEYQTVTHKNIPAWGDAHFDTTYGSKIKSDRNVLRRKL